MEWLSGLFQNQLKGKSIMSNKKKMIFFGIIFVLCIGLIIFTYKTKNIEKKPVYETEEKNETEKENEVSDVAPPDSVPDIKIEYEYTDQIVKGNLVQNDQLNYFQFLFSDFLSRNGIIDQLQEKIVVGIGTQVDDTDTIQFPVDVYLKEEEEPIQAKVNYDTKLENFHFHFLKDELEAAPVEITDIDQELQKYIAKDLEKLQKEFGMYIFEEKLEATKARVTSYEKNGKEIVIQVELNDEYKTYCKIFYNYEKGKAEYKKWG